MSPEGMLEYAHRDASEATAKINYMLTKRRLNRITVNETIEGLRKAASTLERLFAEVSV